jgi:hypothetical protein
MLPARGDSCARPPPLPSLAQPAPLRTVFCLGAFPSPHPPPLPRPACTSAHCIMCGYLPTRLPRRPLVTMCCATVGLRGRTQPVGHAAERGPVPRPNLHAGLARRTWRRGHHCGGTCRGGGSRRPAGGKCSSVGRGAMDRHGTSRYGRFLVQGRLYGVHEEWTSRRCVVVPQCVPPPPLCLSHGNFDVHIVTDAAHPM